MSTVIDIHITLGQVREATGPLDWISFVIVILSTSFLVTCAILMLKKRLQYIPLQTRNTNKMLLWVLFSIILMWSTFISNEHFKSEAISDLHQFSCVVWIFWIQYAVGFNGCFLVILHRSLIILYIFHEKLKKQTHRRLRKFIIILSFSIPLILIAISATINNGAEYDSFTDSCYTDIHYKAALITCILVYCIVFIIISTMMHTGITSEFWNEYVHMRDIYLIWLLVIVANSVIVLTGWTNTTYGRFIFTSSVCLLCVFVYVRLIGVTLWKAIKNDQDYIAKFFTGRNLYDMQSSSLEKMLNIPQIFEEVIEFNLN